ncbi:MAG: response regulator [Suipraeoptans sp.]
MRKYKVIIIDDEEISANGIAMLVEKSDFSVNVEAIFYSSIETFNYLKENTIDIVITDINMPEISGLELIEKIRTVRPTIRFIIFTGYGSLDYAKQAMSYGVKHFLLKPCSQEELNKSLSDCIDDLQSTYEDTILRQKELIKRRILDAVLEEDKYSNLNFGLIMYREKLYEQLHVQMAGLLAGIKYGFSNISGAIVYYILENKDISIQLKVMAENNTGLQTVIFYHKNENLCTVRDSFMLGKQCFDKSFYLDATEIIKNVAEQAPHNKYERHLADCFKELQTLIEKNNITAARDSFIQLKKKAEDWQILSEVFLKKTQAFFNTVMQKYEIDSREILREGVRQPIYAVNYQDLNDFFIILLRFVLEKSDQVLNEKRISAKLNWVIETYYQNKELSLRWISKNILYLNPEYLGKVYLKETSSKFSYQLLEFRMRKAVELLDKGYRISEVADSVGYENPDYFSQQFKKTYGCTPREYINGLRK